MGKIKKYKNGTEKFLTGDKGQRFFNFAYSIGAAVVIWGALFKILHLPGGNTLLCIGMGTEVFMFLLTAFDRCLAPAIRKTVRTLRAAAESTLAAMATVAHSRHRP